MKLFPVSRKVVIKFFFNRTQMATGMYTNISSTSKLGMAGAFIGGIVGIIALNIWGIILGPIIGAFIGELVARKKPSQAFSSALGTFIGFIVGALFKIIVIIVMAGFFIASLF